MQQKCAELGEGNIFVLCRVVLLIVVFNKCVCVSFPPTVILLNISTNKCVFMK